MDMSQKFRLALVGAGMITQGSHLPAALANPAIEVTAIVDPVESRARKLASSYGISPLIATRVEEVVNAIDGAVIATPNGSHKALAVACLDAGVAVLIEKPMAISVAECDEILAAAARTRKVVAIGYSTRFRESTMLLKELLQRDYFGRVRAFVHQFGTPGGWAPLSAYNLTKSSSGGGVMVVTGTHFIDRMLHFWGMPNQVAFEDDSEGGPEANCTARFSFPSGVKGMAIYSKTCSLPGGLVIETDSGKVVLQDFDDSNIQFSPAESPDLMQIVQSTPHMRRASHLPSFQAQLEDFRAACVDGRKPMVDGGEGRDSVALLERLYACRTPMAHAWRREAEVAS